MRFWNVVAGHRNREIGRRLFISVETVKIHLKHIREKLGPKDRTHAVAIADRRPEPPGLQVSRSISSNHRPAPYRGPPLPATHLAGCRTASVPLERGPDPRR